MNFFTRIFRMPTSTILYHLSQTHLSLGDFQILSSWWHLFMDDSCAFGVRLNYFKVWGFCAYVWWGDVSCHGCMRNLPTVLVLLGVSTSPGPHSPRNSCTCGHKCCVHVLMRVWAHRDPVYPSCPCFILTIERNILMCSCSVALETQLLPVVL